MVGRVHSIETFGAVDGPGIRFVIFLQGCPMRCLYCHNPDTWQIDAGQTMSVQDLLVEVKKYQNYFGSEGGVTVSGGEPLMQIDFVIELFRALKKLKIHTCLDLLIEYEYIEQQPTLKQTYEKYLGVYTLERDSEEMWKLLWEHKVLSFFQMEKESGKQAIALSKPHSVDDLAALNSVMRLMAQEKGAESTT